MGQRDQVGAPAAQREFPAEEEPVHVSVLSFVFRPISCAEPRRQTENIRLYRLPWQNHTLAGIEYLVDQPKPGEEFTTQLPAGTFCVR